MSIKPVVALIGRPNVGKSTLFNQFTKSRQALVADLSGLTRDRQYGDATYEDKSFIVVDTGGIGEADDGSGNIDDYMSEQSHTAIHEADIIVFVVDARAGMIGADAEIGKFLHTLGKPVYVVANKVDGVAKDLAKKASKKAGVHNKEARQKTKNKLKKAANKIDSVAKGLAKKAAEKAGKKAATIGKKAKNMGKVAVEKLKK